MNEKINAALQKLHGKRVLLKDLRQDGLVASPNGIYIHEGKTKDDTYDEKDLFGRAFFKLHVDKNTTEFGNVPVGFNFEQKSLLRAELDSHTDVSMHRRDGALQFATLSFKTKEDGAVMAHLERSDHQPQGFKSPIPWLTVPAWQPAFQRMPKGQEIMKMTRFRGVEIPVRETTAPGWNIAIYSLGDSSPVRHFVVPEPGEPFTHSGKQYDVLDWLDLIVQPRTLELQKSTTKDVFDHRTNRLMDVLELAFEHAEEDFPLDYYAEAVEALRKERYTEVIHAVPSPRIFQMPAL